MDDDFAASLRDKRKRRSECRPFAEGRPTATGLGSRLSPPTTAHQCNCWATGRMLGMRRRKRSCSDSRAATTCARYRRQKSVPSRLLLTGCMVGKPPMAPTGKEIALCRRTVMGKWEGQERAEPPARSRVAPLQRPSRVRCRGLQAHANFPGSPLQPSWTGPKRRRQRTRHRPDQLPCLLALALKGMPRRR